MVGHTVEAMDAFDAVKGGAADPPVMMRFTVASFWPLLRRCCSRPSQTVGTPQLSVTRSWLNSRARLVPSRCRPGSTRAAPVSAVA